MIADLARRRIVPAGRLPDGRWFGRQFRPAVDDRMHQIERDMFDAVFAPLVVLSEVEGAELTQMWGRDLAAAMRGIS